jgi:hypothetical protein
VTDQTDELDPFDIDLDENDLPDGVAADEVSDPGESVLAPGGEPETGIEEEPTVVRQARQALRSAKAEHSAAVARVRLASERAINANGAVRLAIAKAVDLEEDEKSKPYQVRAANESVEKYKRARARLELEEEERKKDLEAAEAVVATAEAALTAALASAADAATHAAAEAVRTAQEAEPPQLYYANVDEFVRDFLRHVYRRPVDGRTVFWSPKWWQYDEAMNRLEAIWRAWEHLRLDPATGMSVWWRDHADPHMRVLMSPQGPFRREVDVRTDGVDELPYTAPPAGLFRDERSRGAEPTPPRIRDEQPDK